MRKEHARVSAESAQKELTRRRFLGFGAAATAAALIPSRAMAATAARAASPGRAERVISFFNTHTGERLKTAYCLGGEYEPESLEAINFILRDFRANEIKPIDPGLLDLLHELGGTLETDRPFHIISGYRSPHTNAMLRARGGATSGVASGSLHQVGKAIDIRLPGINLDHLRAAARSLKLGGVGYYPSSNFVHVDTGRVRFW
ncbi:MAG TPA: DUF882 domain-containing protein [Vicinamibacterales bacterium]|jgi:uncharacterized protein YcbK (DUF882 family)|nr:DUF882 domain-containing protein [Vicinamibacterales bacterium]